MCNFSLFLEVPLKEFSDIEFAPAYEDDSDEINDEGHR